MKHIILIGFMGSGKSTVGFRLSYKLKKCLVDTDKVIEQIENMPISQIFAEKGEEYFRTRETDCLRSMFHELGSRIISLGGGTPLRAENRELMKKLGTVIYLQASADTIYQRVKHDTSRPLLQCENPRERIEALLKERDALYREAADIIVQVDGKDMKQVVEEIAGAVQDEDISSEWTEH